MAHDTRDRLIQAARDLFWRKGYHVASIAEILEAAGANSGSLYHFFPTKQDLLLGVLEWYMANLEHAVIAPARQRSHDPIEVVFFVLDGYRQLLLATELTYGCPIGNLALEFKEPDPPVRELLARNFAQWCHAIEACLRQAAHRLPADLDLSELAQFVLTTMEGGVMQARTHRSIEPFDASVRQLKRYMDGLRAEASTPGGHARGPS
jgi:AcrR family transcriptional regulator